MTSKTLAPLTALLLAAGCASPRVVPEEDISAEAHEKAAADVRASAREFANRYDGRAVRYVELYPEPPSVCDPSLPGSCSPFW
ncbi:MAG TPA: hypothetical protein VGG33_02390, partial [Polyangia bacterium]